MPSVSPPQSPPAPHSMPERIQQCPPASYATVLPPEFPPPDPECSSCSIGRPDLRPPSDDRDWGAAHRADAFPRHSLLPLFSDAAFLSAFPPVPPALLSYPAAPSLVTSPASMSVHSSLQNCYAASRSISLSIVIAPSSALITGSLTPSVIGDRPSHPIYRQKRYVRWRTELSSATLRGQSELGSITEPWACFHPANSHRGNGCTQPLYLP